MEQVSCIQFSICMENSTAVAPQRIKSDKKLAEIGFLLIFQLFFNLNDTIPEVHGLRSN